MIFRDKFPLSEASRDLVRTIAHVGAAMGDGLGLNGDVDVTQKPTLVAESAMGSVHAYGRGSAILNAANR